MSHQKHPNKRNIEAANSFEFASLARVWALLHDYAGPVLFSASCFGLNSWARGTTRFAPARLTQRGLSVLLPKGLAFAVSSRPPFPRPFFHRQPAHSTVSNTNLSRSRIRRRFSSRPPSASGSIQAGLRMHHGYVGEDQRRCRSCLLLSCHDFPTAVLYHHGSIQARLGGARDGAATQGPPALVCGSNQPPAHKRTPRRAPPRRWP